MLFARCILGIERVLLVPPLFGLSVFAVESPVDIVQLSIQILSSTSLTQSFEACVVLIGGTLSFATRHSLNVQRGAISVEFSGHGGHLCAVDFFL